MILSFKDLLGSTSITLDGLDDLTIALNSSAPLLVPI
jgi:hypothetical protein